MMRARLGLFTVAIVWGFTFVLQRVATDSIGPFAYNFIRFLLASLVLYPISRFGFETKPTLPAKGSIWYGGILCGSFIFIAAALQQAGLAYTTAGKTAFITSLYIVVVPLLGLLFNQSLRFLSIIGIGATVYGTILLTHMGSSVPINFGDELILISTVCWASQLIAMNYFAPRFPCIKITSIQFLIAGLLNGICTFIFEPLTLTMIWNALIPILYGGIMAAGFGFAMQAMLQRYLPPTETALILSTQMVFASIMGWVFLGETFSTPELIGVIFISIGVLLAQLPYGAKYSIPPLPIWKK